MIRMMDMERVARWGERDLEIDDAALLEELTRLNGLLVGEGSPTRALAEELAGLDVGEDEEDELAGLARQIRYLEVMNDAVRWMLGDLVADYRNRVGRMASYRAAAEGMDKSVRWALALAHVSETFPPEVRYAGVEWNLYRMCATKADPIHALHKAIRNQIGEQASEEVFKKMGVPRKGKK